MIQTLAKAGIVDLSDDFLHRFSFVPDLLCPQRSLEENLSAAINTGLINIMTLHNQYGYRFEAVLYIFATRQGVHIEIPANVIHSVLECDTLINGDIIKNIYARNIPKLDLVRRYFTLHEKNEA